MEKQIFCPSKFKVNLPLRRKKTLEQAFMWMLYSLLHENSKFDAEQMIESWFCFAFDRQPEERDLNNELIDKVRIKLLQMKGISRPILKDSRVWKKIKSEIIFE
jgi:hypothetical protein